MERRWLRKVPTWLGQAGLVCADHVVSAVVGRWLRTAVVGS